MSYDYTLFRAPSDEPEESWLAELPPALGTVEQVQALLAAGCSERVWEQWDGAWIGRCAEHAHGEALLMPEAAGLLHTLRLSRLTHEALVQECRRLGLVAYDNQTGALIRP